MKSWEMKKQKQWSEIGVVESYRSVGVGKGQKQWSGIGVLEWERGRSSGVGQEQWSHIGVMLEWEKYKNSVRKGQKQLLRRIFYYFESVYIVGHFGLWKTESHCLISSLHPSVHSSSLFCPFPFCQPLFTSFTFLKPFRKKLLYLSEYCLDFDRKGCVLNDSIS